MKKIQLLCTVATLSLPLAHIPALTTSSPAAPAPTDQPPAATDASTPSAEPPANE